MLSRTILDRAEDLEHHWFIIEPDENGLARCFRVWWDVHDKEVAHSAFDKLCMDCGLVPVAMITTSASGDPRSVIFENPTQFKNVFEFVPVYNDGSNCFDLSDFAE